MKRWFLIKRMEVKAVKALKNLLDLKITLSPSHLFLMLLKNSINSILQVLLQMLLLKMKSNLQKIKQEVHQLKSLLEMLPALLKNLIARKTKLKNLNSTKIKNSMIDMLLSNNYPNLQLNLWYLINFYF